jgi:pimeloyl-ACP methyl ester carboxylesterase
MLSVDLTNLFVARLSGWWNRELSVAFLEHHFARPPSQEKPVLLLWGDFSGHWTNGVQSYAKVINVVLLKVPPHSTSVFQPADVAWNFHLKCQLRRSWHDHMEDPIAAERAHGASFKLVRPNREMICGWIDQA